jgi:hypothetical protein
MEAERRCARRVPYLVNMLWTEREARPGHQLPAAKTASVPEGGVSLHELAVEDIDRARCSAVVVQLQARGRAPLDDPDLEPRGVHDPAISATTVRAGVSRCSPSLERARDIEPIMTNDFSERTRDRSQRLLLKDPTPVGGMERTNRSVLKRSYDLVCGAADPERG